MMTITPTVKQLLIINILFFIGSQVIGASAYEQLSLFFFESEKFKFWQPVTHMFMHGSISHIAFNMFALYSFGSTLESFWGSKKFLFFYISCGLGAAILHSLVNYYQFHESLNLLLDAKFSKTDIYSLLNQGKIDTRWVDILGQSGLENLGSSFTTHAVGASGAVYGLLVAFAFMFPTAELAMMFIPVPIKAKYFVPGIIAIDLFLGLKGSSIFGSGGTGVAHFAHIGGALIGLEEKSI
jgi:membrane associated rhomboid family serine protease